MSTLRLTTISNQSGSATVPSETVINGSAKAWVNFNGTGTVAIRTAFNVSSITDGGTGVFTINFTNAFADANYAVTAQCGNIGQLIFSACPDGTAPTTTSVRLINLNSAFNTVDPAYCNAAIFR